MSAQTSQERRREKIERLAEAAVLILMLCGLAVSAAVIGMGFIGASMDSQTFTVGGE